METLLVVLALGAPIAGAGLLLYWLSRTPAGSAGRASTAHTRRPEGSTPSPATTSAARPAARREPAYRASQRATDKRANLGFLPTVREVKGVGLVGVLPSGSAYKLELHDKGNGDYAYTRLRAISKADEVALRRKLRKDRAAAAKAAADNATRPSGPEAA